MDDLRWRYVVLGLLLWPIEAVVRRVRCWPLRGPVRDLTIGVRSNEEIDALPNSRRR